MPDKQEPQQPKEKRKRKVIKIVQDTKYEKVFTTTNPTTKRIK